MKKGREKGAKKGPFFWPFFVSFFSDIIQYRMLDLDFLDLHLFCMLKLKRGQKREQKGSKKGRKKGYCERS
jgi:hypothetical protein